MSYTEAEAKQRWCPFARVLATDANGLALTEAAFNRSGPVGTNELRIGPAATCIGSGCMAWVWLEQTTGKCGLVGSSP